MSSDRMLSDDILQDVFLKLYENIDSIVSKESILFWLFKSARNELYTIYRNTKIKKLYTEAEDPEELDEPDSYSLPDEIELKELKVLVIKELEKINPDQKEAFILKEYSGFTYKEIAALTESDEELVKSRLYKARQKLIKNILKHMQ
jgi:RNA polymerase sigma-70 factor (ECF subfamily)